MTEEPEVGIRRDERGVHGSARVNTRSATAGGDADNGPVGSW